MTPLLLSTQKVCALLSVSEKTIRRLVLSGDFPQPIRIGIERNLYDFEDVKRWLQKKKDHKSK